MVIVYDDPFPIIHLYNLFPKPLSNVNDCASRLPGSTCV